MKRKRKKDNQTPSAEKVSNELHEKIWAVITFDRTAASGLTYAEAFNVRADLIEKKESGVCIVTDETAARLGNEKK